MTYRDMTFCTEQSCSKWGAACPRSLTEDVRAKARAWGGERPPITQFKSPKELPCYREKDSPK